MNSLILKFINSIMLTLLNNYSIYRKSNLTI